MIMRRASALLSMMLAPNAACRSTHTSRAHEFSPNEVVLTREQMDALGIVITTVDLQQVDETRASIGRVLADDECAVPASGGEHRSCATVGIDEELLDKVGVGSLARARRGLGLDDVFPGEIDWVASSVDASTKSIRVRCVFGDAASELRPGDYIRIEVIVGTRPAFAIPREAIVGHGVGALAIVPVGKGELAHYRFRQVSVWPRDDNGGRWIPVTGLEPGSLVVTRGARDLAAMLKQASL